MLIVQFLTTQYKTLRAPKEFVNKIYYTVDIAKRKKMSGEWGGTLSACCHLLCQNESIKRWNKSGHDDLHDYGGGKKSLAHQHMPFRQILLSKYKWYVVPETSIVYF